MDVKNLGYICAYSKQYFVRNLGHFVEEFERDEGYYLKNYESKPWLGEAGWRARIAARQNMSKPSRSTHLFKSEAILPEKTTVAVGEKPAALWSMLDGFTAEVEVLEFLYAFVRLVKPSHILETGTWRGFSACAMGHALSRNGFGRITTLEYNPEIAEVASANLSKMHQSENVTVVVGDSREFVPTERIDFALLDSDISIRHLEFLHFKEHFSKSAFVAFHDVAPHHGALNDNVQGLIREGLIHGLDLPTPRGLFLGRVLN
jgi:predicted O-methyltransferase YrrM